MGLRDWIRSRGRTEGGGDTVALVRPVLDVLEPRLLLDADLTGSQPPPCYELTSHDSALYVDLDQQNAASQTNPSAVLTLDVTPCDGTSQPAPTPELSDISAGQAGCVAAAEVTGSNGAVVLPDISADPPTSALLDEGPVSEASPVKIRGPPDRS
jgi:hypothetical protein